MKRLAIAVAVLAVVGVVAVVVLRTIPGAVQSLIPDPEECTANVEGHTSEPLDPDQSQNAALITAISVHRNLPAHAATVALATAMQESKLYNLEGGDRDSIGLFQQRPSQGWGTAKQIADPVYATNAFYDALEKLGNWDTVTVAEAAQAVQHSAYPDAYAKHEPDARALASALTGYSPHAFACRLDVPTGHGRPGQARAEVANLFGLHGVVRGDQLVIPVSQRRTGWAVAQYLLPQTSRFGILRVTYDGHAWAPGHDGRWASEDHAGPQQIVVQTLAP